MQQTAVACTFTLKTHTSTHTFIPFVFTLFPCSFISFFVFVFWSHISVLHRNRVARSFFSFCSFRQSTHSFNSCCLVLRLPQANTTVKQFLASIQSQLRVQSSYSGFECSLASVSPPRHVQSFIHSSCGFLAHSRPDDGGDQSTSYGRTTRPA